MVTAQNSRGDHRVGINHLTTFLGYSHMLLRPGYYNTIKVNKGLNNLPNTLCDHVQLPHTSFPQTSTVFLKNLVAIAVREPLLSGYLF